MLLGQKLYCMHIQYTARLLFLVYNRRTVAAKYNPVDPRSYSATVLLQHNSSGATVPLLCLRCTVTRLHRDNPITGHQIGNFACTAELTARHTIMK